MAVLWALSGSHLLNDAVQAMIPAIYPLLKDSFALSFTQIGLITLMYQGVASLLQPVVGAVADRHPMPGSLVMGMGVTLVGLVVLALAGRYAYLLFGSALVGFGSAVFHPEASRLARRASGGKHGFAQSLFQVGGNFGTALGPLLAAVIVMPRGQLHVLWFSLLAGAAMVLLQRVSRWYRQSLRAEGEASSRSRKGNVRTLPRSHVIRALLVLLVLVFSKYVYLTSLTSYYTFYVIERFGVSVQTSQVLLFLFLFAVTAGTFLGGPIGDRFGRKPVIWFSILGVAPFALILPHVGLVAVVTLTIVIGVVLASAFSAILVFAQELVPNRVGLVAGLFFGFAFGIGGLGSAFLGWVADQTSLTYVFTLCSGLPLLGLLTVFLPGRASSPAPGR